jgi:DNA-binding beta-propeller fold protein YncE
MALTRQGEIALPAHRGQGGFDHAAVHHRAGRLYVAHTANDALDVIDIEAGRYLHSIEGLRGIAGALVAESRNLVFTSNRGENTVGMFSTESEGAVVKVPVGARPNGLAHDPDRGVLLCANVGDPGAGHPPSVTLVDVRARSPLATIPMPGRTRWTVFDPEQRVFFVNIADPALIAAIDPARPDRIVRTLEVPAGGPHGLELDHSERRLFCACDAAKLVSLGSGSGEVLGTLDLSGSPDVIFLNRVLGRLYVAIGDPGVIDVIDTRAWRTVQVAPTGRGAHTIAHDENSNRVYAFLPEASRAVVFQDA